MEELSRPGDIDYTRNPMLKLADAHTEYLVSQPEAGMGYQLVEATLSGYQTKRGIAYNGELLLFEDEVRVRMSSASFNELVSAARRSTEVTKLRVISRTTASRVSESATYRAAAREAEGPAANADEEETKHDDEFKRFHAYENDRRVNDDGSLLKGTYATTAEDAKNVKTGMDAVARYALPNPMPASYVFTIRPHEGTDIQRGRVEPAHDQPGGGVEVIFTDGTQAGTVTRSPKIRDS